MSNSIFPTRYMCRLTSIHNIVLCLSFLTIAPVLYSQDPVYELYDENSGLQNRSLFHCFQDSKLRLWVSSDFGVSQLDGHRFRGLEISEPIPEMTILRVEEDRTGNLWFMTMNGTPIKFDGKKVTTQWGMEFAEKIRGANYLSAFTALDDGSVAFGTHDGRAFRIFPDGHHHFFFSKNWGTVQLIEAKKDGSLVFHFSKVNAIAIWKNDMLTYNPFSPLLGQWKRGPLRTTKLKNGTFVYAVENRIAKVEESGDSLRRVFQILIPEKYITFVGQDNQGDLWVGTNEGAIKYHHDDSLLQFPKRFLPNHFVTSVFRDHEDGVWFSTREGLFHCKNESVLSFDSETPSLNDQATSIFPSQDGTVFIGFESGKIKQISRKTLEVLHVFENQFDNTNPRIQRILDGPNGSTIVASYGGLLMIRNGQIKTLTTTRIVDFKIRGEEACACLFSGWTRIHLDNEEEWTKTISEELINAQTSKTHRCLHCEYENNGTLWISTFSELLSVTASTIDTIYGRKGGDPGFRSSCIAATKSDQIFFGTSNNGLFIFSNSAIFHIGKQNGFLDDHIISVFEDSKGVAWVLTSLGFSKVSFRNEVPKVIASVSRRNLFEGSSAHDFFIINDTVWATAGKGYVIFPTSIFGDDFQPPSVQVSNIWVNGETIDAPQSIVLRYSQNNVRIQFRALTFEDSEIIEYRYRIIGLNDAFQTTKAQLIDLPGLNPGSYQIEIQARFSFGGWGSESAILHFEILAPFWQRWWFYSLELLFFVFVGTSIFWMTLRNIRRKRDVRESLLVSKHEALINQMNPHFVFNCLHSIQNFVLNKETEVANSYLADFASLMRAILINGRSPHVSISDEIKFLKLYLGLESLRLDHKFDFEVIVSKGILGATNVIPTMMLQPLIENSIWHGIVPLKGRRGVIKLKLSIVGNYIECLVSDNGIGRKFASELAQKHGKFHQSLASTIMQERIDLMNCSLPDPIRFEIKDLLDCDGTGIGTEVRLFIPINISK